MTGRPFQLRLRLEMPLEDTLDVYTAAALAKVSPQTMRRWCDEGRFPVWKLVGQWRIDRIPFYEWMRSKRIAPAE
jgi:predicted site-specific integrase-resolvase